MLTPELEKIRVEIEAIAKDYGLDFFETTFEMLDYRRISEVAAYGGFPTRYPHWRYGMEYDQLSKGYIFGLQRIYEMVINNDPCYAYLLVSNPVFDQKTVIAHVYAHCDFFKNNLWFSKTNRRMIDEMANHSSRIRGYADHYGFEVVETFLDAALSLENLIDPFATYVEKTAEKKAKDEEECGAKEIPRIKAKKYMESYINPKEYMEEQKRKAEEEEKIAEKRFPKEPVRDVLSFLIEHAPIKEWQQDVLSIIREEAYYFAPQWMTKILNEGWATFWHSKIMTERAMKDSELVDYASHYAGVVASQPGRLNPYKLGVELLRDIEDRWDKGRFGKDYEDCSDMKKKLTWDRELGLGREKIFEVRKFYNDVTFIDEFLTPEFVREHKLYTFGYNPGHHRWEIFSRKFEEIKKRMLDSLTNAGNPFIYVTDGNFRNAGELLLTHRHEGTDLRMDYAREVLKNIRMIWDRPVGILTRVKDKAFILRFDGDEFTEAEIKIGGPEEEENGDGE